MALSLFVLKKSQINQTKPLNCRLRHNVMLCVLLKEDLPETVYHHSQREKMQFGTLLLLFS